MPQLNTIETRQLTRSRTVRRAISAMQLQLWRTLTRESAQSRNTIKVPTHEEIRDKVLSDILAVEFLNDALDIVGRNGEIQTYSATFSNTDFSQNAYGGWSMTYPVAAYRIDEVLYSTGSDEGDALEAIISNQELEVRDSNWRNAGTGTPKYGILWGKDRFGLYPKPSDSTYSVDLIGIGKPSSVGYDSGSATPSIPSPTPTTHDFVLTDSNKQWATDQWQNGIVEIDPIVPYNQKEYTIFENTGTVLKVVAGNFSNPIVNGDIAYRVDNILPLPNEYHPLVIDTATNIVVLGSATAAEEFLLQSKAWRNLKADSSQTMYIEPFREPLRPSRR